MFNEIFNNLTIFPQRYQVEEMGFSYTTNKFGLVIKFGEEVDISTSHFTIQPLTLFARIGGIIGVGQVLYWFLTSFWFKSQIICLFFSGHSVKSSER